MWPISSQVSPMTAVFFGDVGPQASVEARHLTLEIKQSQQLDWLKFKGQYTR